VSGPLRRTWLLAVALLLGLAAAPRPVAAQELVADLSSHLIAITTGFTGTSVVLFGAVEGPGDVVIIVRGPSTDVAVRRKARIAGLWINRDRITFGNVPSFYAMASSRPIEAIGPPELLDLHEVGFDHLKLETLDADVDPADVPFFRRALIREKEREGLFARNVAKVSFLGSRLFRTTFDFPANVPTGNYLVEVLLVRDRAVASAQTTPLFISKIGVGASIFDFAHDRGAGYGGSRGCSRARERR
jgi:uncharacterized protein (TIGR02186 family)